MMAKRKPPAPKGRPRLIGLCAWAPGSGKSTVARMLGWELGHCTRVSFADPVRAVTAAFLEAAGYEPDAIPGMLNDPAVKELPLALPGQPTPRYLMRTLGTEWGRMLVSKEIWLHLAEVKIRQALDDDDKAVVVIDDVRFPDEYKMIHRLGGHIIAISRMQADEILRIRQEEVGVHASDAPPDLENVDWVITNDLELDDLRKQVKQLVEFGYNSNPGSRAQPLFEIPF